ncbi:MAG: YceI family protein [Bacteroidia bacterium]
MKIKSILQVVILLLLAHLSFAQTPLKVVSSAITFTIKNAGLKVNGSFSGLEADIRFRPTEYKASTIKASVNANTIKTGIDARDNHLKKAEYFDVVNFPKITMESSFFGKEGNRFIGYFKLTIKGITKDISVPFTFEDNVFKGSFTIDRRHFKVGGNSMILGDNVKVDLLINTKN